MIQNCVRVAKVSRVLVRLRLALSALATQGVHHALKLFYIRHTTSLTGGSACSNASICRRAVVSANKDSDAGGGAQHDHASDDHDGRSG